MKMNQANRLFIGLLAFAVGPVWSDSDEQLLRCGALLDVEEQRLLQDTSILVRGEVIEEVGQDLVLAEGAREIDLTDLTCAPGFMDMHVHLAHESGAHGNPISYSRSASWRALRSLANAQAMLNRGFTTIRTLGFDSQYETIDLRDAINRGELDGPRIYVAPHGVMGEGSSFIKRAIFPEGAVDDTRFVLMGTGPEEMRKITAREIAYGADWIKILDAWGTTLTLEDTRAIVEEARRQGKKVAQHVTLDPEHKAAKLAIAAGVDSIEHAFITDPDVLREMAEKGIYYVPTIWIIDYIARQPPGTELTPGSTVDEQMSSMLSPFLDVLKQSTRLAHELGVKIALGSDTVFDPARISDAVEEFGLLAEAADDPWMALRAGTIVAAEMLGEDARIGSITKGKLADIVAMPGNPIQDPTLTEQVSFVMKGGKIIRR